MFDHVDIVVSELGASREFYELALGSPTSDAGWVEWGDFGIVAASPDRPVTARLHIGFGVESPDEVDAWWTRMTEAGHPSDGEPGPRPQYGSTYYGGFVLDPDGNSVEAVHHGGTRAGEMDHLWLRTGDVAEARRFYDAVAPAVGLRRTHDSSERVQFRFSDHGSFSFVAGDEPTRNVHLAFRADDRETVEAFHRAATTAGFRDNGAPGERPQYHVGYFGAYVLDADGHNIEAVYHGT